MTSTHSSDYLMKRFLQGQQQAFFQIVAQWKQPLVNYFYQRTQNLPLAEDLAQEVFIRVYRVKNYQLEGKFSAWIYRIAQNILRDYWRQGKLDTVSVDQSTQAQQIPSPQVNQVEQLIEQEQQQWVYQALNRLVPEEQGLIILSQVQGLSYQEVADLNEVPLSVIKGKIYRAMQRLIKCYHKEHESHAK